LIYLFWQEEGIDVVTKDGKKTIVVVDDSVDFQHAMTVAFRNEPFEILTFKSGEEAIEYIREMQIRPDQVILDIELKIGGLSGFEVARILRGKLFLECPIVFVSAEPTVDVWPRHVPNSKAVSKLNSLRKICREILAGVVLKAPSASLTL
jgi:CheY-like chemotaxis protein